MHVAFGCFPSFLNHKNICLYEAKRKQNCVISLLPGPSNLFLSSSFNTILRRSLTFQTINCCMKTMLIQNVASCNVNATLRNLY
jgi:hypothetical protein